MTDKKKPQKKHIRTSESNRLAPNAPTKKKAKSQKKQSNFSLWKFLLKWCFIFAIWGAVMVTIIVLYYAHDLPDLSELTNKNRKPSITIVADPEEEGGKPVMLAQYGDLYGEYVDASVLPQHLINAVLATEDRRFFDHFGIDPIGILRAAYTNFQAKRIVQGGSTITQQLAKNLFLTSDRTIKRKIQEMILALWLEQRFTKNEILTLYLNRVYLGAGNYGIDAASRFYFQKSAMDVNLYESAILAGLLKAPSRYAPSSNPDRAFDRANQVLENMANAEMLTADDITNALDDTIIITPTSRSKLTNPYFADWIMEQLPNYIGAVEQDLIIVTTLDPRLQKIAEDSITTKMATDAIDQNVEQAAMLVMTTDGEIKAMVGGKNYFLSQFNRATKALRQPGSSFKPFVYLTALEQGMTPEDIVVDEPVRFDGWKPSNYNNEYLGEITLQEALGRSVNTIAVKLAYQTGLRPILDNAMKLGITSDLDADLTLALGSSGITLLEMTQAYAHFANHGNAVWAHGIKEIRDVDGNIIYQRMTSEKPRVISKEVTAYMNQMLMYVIQEGTGRGAQLNRDAAGKTGTSQDFRDAWFIGYTADLVAGVWMGNDDNSPMKGVTGGAIPARIWQDFMRNAPKDGWSATVIPTSTSQIHDDGEERTDESIWGDILRSFGTKPTTEKIKYDYPPYNR